VASPLPRQRSPHFLVLPFSNAFFPLLQRVLFCSSSFLVFPPFRGAPKQSFLRHFEEGKFLLLECPPPSSPDRFSYVVFFISLHTRSCFFLGFFFSRFATGRCVTAFLDFVAALLISLFPPQAGGVVSRAPIAKWHDFRVA